MSHWAEIDDNNKVIRVLVGDNNLLDEGYQWLIDNLGGVWIQTSYNGNIRKNFAYHRSAIGLASGAEVSTELNYIPEKAAHLATSMMSQGAVLIDTRGVYEVQAYEA